MVRIKLRSIDFLKLGIFSSFFIPSYLGSMFYILTLLIFLAISFISISATHESTDLKRPQSHVPILLLCLVIFLSYFLKWTIFGFNDHTNLNINNYSSAISLSIYAVIALISLFGTFIIISNMQIKEYQIFEILYFIVKCGLLSALLTLIFWFLETGASFGRYNYTPPISGSHGIQLYQMIISFLSLIILFTSSFKNKPLLFLYGSIILLCMTTLIVREAWLIFFVTLSISYLKLSKQRFFTKFFIFSLGILLASIGIIITSSSLNLSSDIVIAGDGEFGESILIRFIMLQESFNLFLDNVLLGIGYGNYVTVIQHTILLESGAEILVSTPHNGLAMVLTENGILGLLALIFIGLYLYKDLKIKSKFHNNLQTNMSGVVSSFFLLLFIDQIVSNSLILPPPNEINFVQLSYLIWVLFAITVAFNRKSDLLRNHSRVNKR